MDGERPEDDSLRECERRFREVCMQVINKQFARSPRKKLFGNAKPEQKIALRPSMIDRACLKKAVVSSTPMVNDRHGTFTPESSGSVSSISDFGDPKLPKNAKPVVRSQHSNAPLNGTIINISSTNETIDKQSAGTSAINQANNTNAMNSLPQKSKKLDNIISKLVFSRSIIDQQCDNVCNSSNKNIQTSKDSTKQASKVKHFSKTLFGTRKIQVGQTQTGLSLEGDMLNRPKSVSDSSDNSETSNTIRTCEVNGLLAPNLAGNRDDVSTSDDSTALDVGLPWRAPSDLKISVPPLVHSVIPKGDSLEDTLDDDTFLPKPQKKKKVFVNKKKKSANRVQKDEKLNNANKEKAGKVKWDTKTKFVEKGSTKENEIPVASTTSGLSPPRSKKKRQLQNTSRLPNTLSENNNELSIRDCFVSLTIEKKIQNIEDINRGRKDKENTFSENGKNNMTLNNVRNQESSFKKPQTKHAVIAPTPVDSEESDLDGTVTRGKSRSKQQSKPAKEGANSKSNQSRGAVSSNMSYPVSGETNFEDSINARKKQKNSRSDRECRNANIENLSVNAPSTPIHNVETHLNRTVTRSMSRIKQQSKQTKEDAALNNHNSDETNVSRSARRKHKNSSSENERRNANLQNISVNVSHSKENAENKKGKQATSERELEERVDDLIGDAQTSICNLEVTEVSRIRSPKKQTKGKGGKTKSQTDEPEVTQDILLEPSDAIPEVQTRITRSSPQIEIQENKETNINEKNDTESTSVLNTGGNKHKSKRYNGTVKILQTSLSQFVECNDIEDILPEQTVHQTNDLHNSLNLHISPETQKKNDKKSNKDNTKEKQSAGQINVDTSRNKSRNNKEEATVIEETFQSNLDSGIGASSQQLETFKKPAPVTRRETSEEVSQLSIRRSTRERRAPPIKCAGYIVCNSQKKYNEMCKTIDPIRNARNRLSRIPGRRNAPSTIRKKPLQPVTSFVPIPEVNEFDATEQGDLQTDCGSSTSYTPVSTNKNYVLNGRTQKRQSGKSSDKKILESLNKTLESTTTELNEILNICDGDRVKAVRWSLKNPKFSKLNGMPGVSACVTENFSNGLLKIDGGSNKPRQVASHHQLSFCVLEGRGEVGVQDKRQKFTVFENFIVPPGCEYFIKNLNAKKPLLLFFTKIPKLA